MAPQQLSGADQGWNIKTVKEVLGAGKSDDQVIEVVRRNNYVLVTTDRKLVRRCKNLNISVVELGVEVFAEAVNRQLAREFPTKD